jgi:hypothetical protein
MSLDAALDPAKVERQTGLGPPDQQRGGRDDEVAPETRQMVTLAPLNPALQGVESKKARRIAPAGLFSSILTT